MFEKSILFVFAIYSDERTVYNEEKRKGEEV